MGSDNRSVATDALETLGTIIGEGAGRDAIHLAVEPVIASERLIAGQDVFLLPDGRAAKGKVHGEYNVGIVDPFLKKTVKTGEKFWLVVYPRQITSLRHVWTHPSFDDPIPAPISEVDKEKARHIAERLTNSGERWLRDWCAKNDSPSYESIMEAIKNGGSSTVTDSDGDSYGSDAHGSIPPEFWDHVEAVTGNKQELRPTYFSCSC